MVFWVSIAFILCAIFSFPAYITWRAKRMRHLATELSLSYRTGDMPSVLDLFFGTFRGIIGPRTGEKVINHIEGNVNGHRIHVYDRIHFFWDASSGLLQHTVVEVDGKVFDIRIDGSMVTSIPEFKWYEYSVFGRRLAPIAFLRRFLVGLK